MSQFILLAPEITSHLIIPKHQFAVCDHPAAEARPQSNAQEIAVAARVAHLFQFLIDFGQDARHSFAVGKQIAVVVDENRNSECLFQERTEGNATPECREIGQVADNPCPIIRRTGKGETYRHRIAYLLLDCLETAAQGSEASLQIIGYGRETDRLDDFPAILEGGKDQVGASRVQCHNDSVFFFHIAYCLKRIDARIVPHCFPSEAPYGRMVYSPTASGMIKVSA